MQKELDAEANDFLENDALLTAATAGDDDSTVEAWLEKGATSFRLISRKEHMRAIRFVYSIWIRSSRSAAVQAWISSLRYSRKRWDRRTTALHLIAQAVISYGDDEDASSSRRLHQRDVAAVSYLASKNVGPQEIEPYARRYGGGLDEWARRWPKSHEGSDTPKSSRAAAQDETIRVTIRRADKQGKRTVQRLSILPSADVECALALLVGSSVEKSASLEDDPSQLDHNGIGNGLPDR